MSNRLHDGHLGRSLLFLDANAHKAPEQLVSLFFLDDGLHERPDRLDEERSQLQANLVCARGRFFVD